MDLKYADKKLTGKLPLPNKPFVTIEAAGFKDNEISFSATQQGAGGEKLTTKYQGKLDGNTIKGKSQSNIPGLEQPKDWEATREKP